MFPENYSLGLVISAVATFAVILLLVRIYLGIINRNSDIQKPDWMDDKFEEKFGKKGGGKQ